MSKYEPFAEWETDDGWIATDDLHGIEPRISIGVEDYWLELSPTDIKRLMECVERWEAFCEVRMEVGE